MSAVADKLYGAWYCCLGRRRGGDVLPCVSLPSAGSALPGEARLMGEPGLIRRRYHGLDVLGSQGLHNHRMHVSVLWPDEMSCVGV
jgi:hypothetical protein